ncbi:MAG: hypothetical protein MZU97_24065 [Bacillus subtilis]|nr:hypothetical protein [Bacillus subtilis]
MNFELDQSYAFFGRVDQINPSTYDTFPVNVTAEDGEKLIVRVCRGNADPAQQNLSFRHRRPFYSRTKSICGPT